MNLPNCLTLLRIVLTFLFIVFLVRDGLTEKIVAALLFAMAALTDYLDGHLARAKGLITNFGKIMDPIADKFLVLSAFYVFAYLELIPFWIFGVIAIREVGITAWRLQAVSRGTVMAAETAGKYKTILQMLAIGAILFYEILWSIPRLHDSFWNAAIHGFFYAGILALMSVAVGLTVWSGILFIWHNRQNIHVR
ncbi:MAG: CDP-diacylglycerol--glycerol-3-phosphate 3-phosphatidyltransferase [Candidatus Omnitrophota bacterium]|nr:CDP-diacylglycerol--glycerol-3-phosphate 3-phosphatidyltransferase [Candidatus Omnitrophota bacterium]